MRLPALRVPEEPVLCPPTSGYTSLNVAQRARTVAIMLLGSTDHSTHTHMTVVQRPRLRLSSATDESGSSRRAAVNVLL